MARQAKAQKVKPGLGGVLRGQNYNDNPIQEPKVVGDFGLVGRAEIGLEMIRILNRVDFSE